MLTRSDIRKMTVSTTYQRGMGIYIQAGKIRTFDVETDMVNPELDNIRAVVRGSGRSCYDVDISYNTAADDVEYGYCSCPAFENYRGPCKHCVAVLLEYADHQQENRSEYEDFLPREVPSESLSKGVRQGLPYNVSGITDVPGINDVPGITDVPAAAGVPATTASLKALIEKEITRKTAPALQPELQGAIGLYPYLEIKADGEACVSFKIGGEKPYVLKDVFSFADRVKHQKEYAYGKKLSFIHTMEAFEPASQAYVRFLTDWVRDYSESYQTEQNRRYAYYYYGGMPAMRYVPLRGEALEKLLQAAYGNELQASIYRQSETLWTVRREKPHMGLQIKSGPDGAELRLFCPAAYCGIKYMIFFEEGDIYLADRKDLPGLEEFVRCFDDDKTAFVTKADLPGFCTQLLPQLRQYMRMDYEDFDPADYAPQEAKFQFYLDAPTKDSMTCQVKSIYGEEVFGLPDRTEALARRDLVREAEVLRAVSPFFEGTEPGRNLFVLQGDDGRIYDLLTSGIDAFREMGEVFVSDALKNIRVHPAPSVSAGVSMSGSLLELKLLAGDMSKADLVDILSRYDRKKRYHRLKNGDFIDIDEGIDVLAELKEGLHLTSKELLGDHILLPKYRAVYLDQALKEKASLPVERDRDFRALIRGMRSSEDSDYELPGGLHAELREYQKRGYLWMKTLAEYGFGGILADDMGLGKTLQVITYLQSEFEEKGRAQRPHLIVCPASLVYNWESELQRFAPELPVRTIAGTAAERKSEIDDIRGGDVCITSYELLRRDVHHYEELTFGCQVIDEAQYIKNHSTQASKAVRLIHSSFRMALTGTPVENRLSELWSIFDYLMPGFLYGYDRFRKELEQPIVLGKDEAAMGRLKKLIGPFVLRRLKGDVLRDLPDKIEKNMFTKLSGEQQKLYDADVKQLQLMLSGQSDEEFNTSKIQVLSALTRLRQICCDPGILFEDYRGESAKMEMCMDLIENAAEGGHKILLFSQFTTLLARLQQRLVLAGISYYTLTGATKKEERARLVNAFNEDETQVFLISLKAGGTGLNLTAADVVIHFDPWWNLAVQNQATDRAHRIGQKNVVSVYKLIAKGTIEEKILELQEQKRQLADQLLAGGDMASPSFDREELLALLG